MNEWNLFFASNVGHFQTMGIGLLTVLIPFGIYILENLKNTQYPKLDTLIFKKDILLPKDFVIMLLGLLGAPIIWTTDFFPSQEWFQPIFFLEALVIWIISALWMLFLLRDSWGLVGKSDDEKRQVRRDFLKKSGEKRNFLLHATIWREIWENEDLSFWEKYFFKDFIKTIKQTKENELMVIFLCNLEKRDFDKKHNYFDWEYVLDEILKLFLLTNYGERTTIELTTFLEILWHLLLSDQEELAKSKMNSLLMAELGNKKYKKNIYKWIKTTWEERKKEEYLNFKVHNPNYPLHLLKTKDSEIEKFEYFLKEFE